MLDAVSIVLHHALDVHTHGSMALAVASHRSGLYMEASKLALGRHKTVEEAALALPTVRAARREKRVVTVNPRYLERIAAGVKGRKAAGWRDSRRTPNDDVPPRG